MRTRTAIAVALASVALLMLSAVTSAADKDKVRGSATFDLPGGSQVWLQAKSDADGSNPSGTYRLEEDGLTIEAEVVCLFVDGRDAVVGLTVTATNEPLLPIGTGMLHYVVDAGGPGTNDAAVTIIGLDASACDGGEPPLIDPTPVQTGNWVVQDA